MIRRTDWEQARYRVADHTTSPPVDVGALVDVVIHYPGTSGPITTLDPIVWTQNLQRSYVDGRGYSVGYNFGYWADGTEIELRGYDYRNAANAVNGDPTANRRTLSLLVIVGGQNPATAAQLEAVRARRAEINARTGRDIGLKPHGALEPTQCPGTGIGDQITAGLFNPQPAPIPPPPGDDTMPPTCYYTDTVIKGTFALVAGRWVPWLFEPGLPHFKGDHPYTREQVLHDQGAAAAEMWRKR